jgi:hypothetical protein
MQVNGLRSRASEAPCKNRPLSLGGSNRHPCPPAEARVFSGGREAGARPATISLAMRLMGLTTLLRLWSFVLGHDEEAESL